MSAEGEIRRRIRDQGPITFAKFMELALFWPNGGYYLGPERVGQSGDFYTSPLVHPAFGALLAVQLFQFWQLLDCPAPFTVVDMGAGYGLLGRDIVDYSAHLPAAFGRSLRYICIDRRTAPGVETKLTNVGRNPTLTRLTASGVPLRNIKGCFLSNEFLDSFPVHQVTVQQGRVMELYVTLDGDELIETFKDPSTPELAERLTNLGISLAEGQIAEINLGLERWANEVAAALEAGFVLTIDYGQPADVLYSFERRRRGTLTTFHKHVQIDSPLRHIGQQDITAQVDFTSVADAGRLVGMDMLKVCTQRQFLLNLGLADWQRHLALLDLPQRQAQANQTGLLDLVRPGGLGNFTVLAQGKNVPHTDLWGFEPLKNVPSSADKLPIPLLTTDHLFLLDGLGQHTDLGFEAKKLLPYLHGISEESV